MLGSRSLNARGTLLYDVISQCTGRATFIEIFGGTCLNMPERSVVEPFVDVTGFERSIASSRPGLLKEPVEKKKKR